MPMKDAGKAVQAVWDGSVRYRCVRRLSLARAALPSKPQGADLLSLVPCLFSSIVLTQDIVKKE